MQGTQPARVRAKGRSPSRPQPLLSLCPSHFRGHPTMRPLRADVRRVPLSGSRGGPAQCCQRPGGEAEVSEGPEKPPCGSVFCAARSPSRVPPRPPSVLEDARGQGHPGACGRWAAREGLPGSRAPAGPGSEGSEAGSRRGLGLEWRRGAAGDGGGRGHSPAELSAAAAAARGPGTPIPPAPLPLRPPAGSEAPGRGVGDARSGPGSEAGGCLSVVGLDFLLPRPRHGRVAAGGGGERNCGRRAGPGRAGAEVTDRAALRLRPSAVSSPAPCPLLPRGSRGSPAGAGLFAIRDLPKHLPKPRLATYSVPRS